MRNGLDENIVLTNSLYTFKNHIKKNDNLIFIYTYIYIFTYKLNQYTIIIKRYNIVFFLYKKIIYL